MTSPGPFVEILGRLAYAFSQVQPFLPTYLHLLLSALFPIFAGSHASLSRPPSAAKPDKGAKDEKDEQDEDSDEEEKDHQMEGLSPVDAIMLPVLAGSTLAGLYFLIKWLEDPALLNKILNWYFSLFGVLSVGKLIRDTFEVTHSLIFPKSYVAGGLRYHVNSKKRLAVPVDANARTVQPRSSPLPGVLSRVSLGPRAMNVLWSLRDLPKHKLLFKLYVRRIVAAKASLGPLGALSFFIALGFVLYFNLVDKPWWLTNLMGFGFAYSALQVLSPTTFPTGSLILGALFFYDIYFVFFTPMMVTVAKSLDIPIKLVFPRPSDSDDEPGSKPNNYAMLGLGDVVLPGIMIGLALRFDLYLFYLRKQLKSSDSLRPEYDEKTKTAIIKPKYVSVSNRWGERFWCWSPGSTPTPRDLKAHITTRDTATFPKVYFYASVVGYIFGMLVTLTVMHVAAHAQPALLYLVPGVLGSLWGTALLRGELKEMWEFSEAIEEEANGKTKKANADSTAVPKANKSIFSSEKQERQAQRLGKVVEKYIQKDDPTSEDESTKHPPVSPQDDEDQPKFESSTKMELSTNAKEEASSKERTRKLVEFSISLPRSVFKEGSESSHDKTPETHVTTSPNGDALAKEASGKFAGPRWKAPKKDGAGPAEKRQRTA